MEASAQLALLIVGIFVFIALLAWFAKGQVKVFAEALTTYRRARTRISQSEA
jgi:hypothetical protein